MINENITLDSLKKTGHFGMLLGELALPGDVYCLDGDLGAGKTTLTQSIAKGVSVPNDYYITSPSYNIMHEYPGRMTLYHMDFYRLDGAEDVINMGLEEFFYLSGLTVIEWSKRAKEVLPSHSLSIFLKILSTESRVAVLQYEENTWQDRVTQLLKILRK